MTEFPHELCSICHRAAAGYGWAPHPSKPPVWVCDDEECLRLAPTRYAVKQDVWTKIEGDAAAYGGDCAGQYLDSIGKTDLADLSKEEWDEACKLLVAGYRSELVRLLGTHAPPF